MRVISGSPKKEGFERTHILLNFAGWCRQTLTILGGMLASLNLNARYAA